MQEGFTNGYRFWLSSEGYAIWRRNDGTRWYIAHSKYLGRNTYSLLVPIMDPNNECPHDNLNSNWVYFDPVSKDNYEDVFNDVKIDCLKGMLIMCL